MPAETMSRFRVEGMDCAACVTKIENAVGRLPGVEEVSVSLAAGTLRVSHGEALAKGAVEQQVRRLGYGIAKAGAGAASASARPAHDHDSHNHDDHDHSHRDLGHDNSRAPAPSTSGAAAGGGDHDDHLDIGSSPWWRSRKAVQTGACAAALVVAYAVSLAFPAVGHWAFIVALAVGLVPIALRAFSAANSGTPFTIETLMTIAAVGAVIIGATEEAATVVLLFLVGELLEGVAARRARSSISSLTSLVPKVAQLEDNGATREVPADGLRVGNIIVVRPGDRVPADGDILEGSGAIDESPVTGESVPVRKGKGDQVFAGTINTDAVLRIKVTAAAADNTIARVVKLVEEAQESKAPTERFIDQFSRWYTPGVLVFGALVAIVPPLAFGQSWAEWVYKGLAVLLIGCPCALVISTPAAIAAGLAAGAKRGLLMKGGAVVEKLRTVTMVALDKTGTLTTGRPEVTDTIGVDRTETQVLSLAAALETGSSHPLAMAIRNKAKADKVPIPPSADVKVQPGRGVTGRVGGETVAVMSAKAADGQLADELRGRIDALSREGKSISIVTANDRVVGLIGMRDTPRPDAKAALAALKSKGIGTVMLTGDNERTAKAVGADLGIDVRAQLLPEDKQTIVRELQAQGQVVAKVGDGINDAPALAAADIGVAMGGGTDVALETADAAVLHGRVADIAGLIDLSKATMGNITQNISVALGLKALFLVTTLIGITGLWPAILADTGATVLVTANAMRLLGWRPRSA